MSDRWSNSALHPLAGTNMKNKISTLLALAFLLVGCNSDPCVDDDVLIHRCVVVPVEKCTDQWWKSEGEECDETTTSDGDWTYTFGTTGQSGEVSGDVSSENSDLPSDDESTMGADVDSSTDSGADADDSSGVDSSSGDDSSSSDDSGDVSSTDDEGEGES